MTPVTRSNCGLEASRTNGQRPPRICVALRSRPCAPWAGMATFRHLDGKDPSAPCPIFGTRKGLTTRLQSEKSSQILADSRNRNVYGRNVYDCAFANCADSLEATWL
jgi:hypothetical protein